MKSSHECIYEGCDEPTGGRRYCIRHFREIEAAKDKKEKEEIRRLLKRKEHELSKNKTYAEHKQECEERAKRKQERKREQKEFLKKFNEESKAKGFEYRLKTGIWAAICERITVLRKKKRELEEKGFETEGICKEIDVLIELLRDK